MTPRRVLYRSYFCPKIARRARTRGAGGGVGGGHRERWQGWRSGQRRIQSGESDAPLGAITISDQVRIFTTCQISPRCPQRARNYILQTDWKVVFVARCMRPASCICLGLSEAYPFHNLLPVSGRDPRHSAYHFAPRLSVTRTQKRDTRDQCDLPPFHNRPYSFTDTALPIEGRSQLSMAFTHCTLLLLFDSTSRP